MKRRAVIEARRVARFVRHHHAHERYRLLNNAARLAVKEIVEAPDTEIDAIIRGIVLDDDVALGKLFSQIPALGSVLEPIRLVVKRVFREWEKPKTFDSARYSRH